MEKIQLDKELSAQLYKEGKYIAKHCYDNVFDNISSVGFKFKEDLRIMFCYVSVGIEGLYTRHACYYIDGMAVDPTFVDVYEDKFVEAKVDYIPFKIMTVDEYFDLLDEEEFADLFKTLAFFEKMKRKELEKNGIVIIG
ncbi:hypothetical protein ACIQ1D_18890 [Lysinibacillus xylanilyticus]|uniref:hypothetical protein n=1 Tax=Lysinibacillus xylanilyticus TaxID=582475 RepID=UPI0038094BFF